MSRKKEERKKNRKEKISTSFRLSVSQEGGDILMEEGKYFLGTLSMVCYFLFILQQCFGWEVSWWLLALLCLAVTAIYSLSGVLGGRFSWIRIPLFVGVAAVLWLRSEWRGILYHISQETASRGIGFGQISGAEYGEVTVVCCLVAFILCVLLFTGSLAEHCPVLLLVCALAGTVGAVFLGWMPNEQMLCALVAACCLLSPSLAGGMAAVAAVAFVIFVGSMFVDMEFEEESSKIATFLEEWRFGEGSTARTAGDLSGTLGKNGEETALIVTMQEPSSCYLRGYTGMVYGDNTWNNDPDVLTKLEMGLQTGEQDMFGYLRVHGFSSRILLGESVCRKAEKPWKKQLVSIENVGADRRYYYLPYELAETEMSLADEFPLLYGAGENIYASGLRGVLEYSFQAYPCLAGETGEKKEDGRLVQYEQYMKQICLALPKEVRDILAEALGRQTVSSVATERETADWIRSWLSSNITYTNHPDEIAEDTDFARWFFQEKKEGGEVQFAAAGVMLFRYMGIPARYAEGYLVSPLEVESAQAGQMRIPQKNIHAWTEIYIEEKGWVPVELVKDYEAFMQVSYLYEKDTWKVENDASDSEVEQRNPKDEPEMTDEETEQPEPEEKEKVPSSGVRKRSGSSQDGGDNPEGWNRGFVATAVAALFIALLLLAVFLRYEGNRRKRRKWRTSGDCGWGVRQSYRELEEALHRGWHFLKKEEWRQDNRTEVLAERLCELDDQVEEELLSESLRIRQKAVYGRNAITPAEREVAVRFFEEETTRILGMLSRYHRWRFFLRRI